MRPKELMIIAGEASGDVLAAELVNALRVELPSAPNVYTDDLQPLHGGLQPRFFGAGGPRMAAAGVELAFDMTQHAVVGLWEPLKALLKFRRMFRELYRLALRREPDAIVCVDFGGFNLRFARAIRKRVGTERGWFRNWRPKLIQYVSPQVWASREGRAKDMARDYDLLLSTLPFEKAWYAERIPDLHVEWVGHPLIDRYAEKSAVRAVTARSRPNSKPNVVLLPGSRRGELRRHLPLLAEVASRLGTERASFQCVVPSEALAGVARVTFKKIPGVDVRVGVLDEMLANADLAITKSGTITLECAYFRVPAIVFYRTSALTYLAARQVATVKYLAMPNILADEPLFPEFIQSTATAENIAAVAMELLRDTERQEYIKTKLSELVAGLGTPGASRRAARHIAALLR